MAGILDLGALKNSVAPNLNGFNQGTNDPVFGDVGGAPGATIFNEDSTTFNTTNMEATYALDSFFFNWPGLDTLDAFNVYPYNFIVHDNGSPVLILNMPLMPQNINISVPSTTVTTVTMGSISEEHNGAPLRPIVVSGTSGIKPVSNISENQDTNGSPSSGLLNYLFANTISAVGSSAQNAANAASNIYNAVAGNNAINSPLVANSTEELENTLTGYEVIHSMMRFFDWYLDAKKNGATNLCLCFCMYKDRMFYDVSLNGYNVRKAAGTMEYEYTINMTAWRRRKEAPGGVPEPTTVKTGTAGISPNYLAKLNLALQTATATIASVSDILNGVRADFSANVLQPIKQVGLLIAAAANAKLAVNNFPNTIANSLKDAVSKFHQANQNPKVINNINNALTAHGIRSGLANDGQHWGAATDYFSNKYPYANTPSGQSKSGTTAGFSSALTTKGQDSDPINQIFANPDSFQDVLALIPINQLELNAKTQQLITNATNAALAMTAVDVAKTRESVNTFSAQLSATAVARGLNTDDIALLSAFNDVIMTMDTLINSMQSQNPNPTNDYVQFFANYAATQGITFEANASKFYIPFPYGATLESLAYQYLGNADRWMEIAAINALKPPYIDETGFQVPLLDSGSGNNVIVSSSDNLYIGQVVLLKSSTQSTSKRHITKIVVESPVETVVFFDGAPNLNLFTVADGAYFQAFLPGTVNSNMMIAIPSKVPVNIPGSIQVNPDLQDLTSIAAIAKVDFLLATKSTYGGYYDLAFGAGDILLSSGMNNLVQAGLIKLLTKQNELLNDPTFGNPIQVGSNSSDINLGKALNALSNTFAQDPRFTGIIAGKAQMTGPTVAVSIVAGVSGSKAYLPLTAAIPV